MKVTFITTVFNESETIIPFLKSLNEQSKYPDQIVIVDGGSSDSTVQLITEFPFVLPKNKVIITIKKGNRSIGRNKAISLANNEIIVCSDSGNILDKEWIKHITAPFTKKHVDVVAGFYKGIAKTVFQRSLIPYALMMPDKVNAESFLPATRSIAFKKSVWEKVGKFDEKLSHNEDYAFAKKLQKSNCSIVFANKALVYWIPRDNFKDAYIMFYRFAYGDAEARIFRPKVIFLFTRYILGLSIFVFSLITQNYVLCTFLLVFLLLYILWAILKNYRYVRTWEALYILPSLQFIADVAVLKGTIWGAFGKKAF